MGKIEPRHGCEVYTSDEDFICIKQDREGEGEQIIILHPEEAVMLVGLLTNEINDNQPL